MRRKAVRRVGLINRVGDHLIAVENTPQLHNMIVCTLCSCYPWEVLGLPPVWYKSAPYRSRAVNDPRGVLADFGVTLPADTEIRVWDSTAETRFIVLPMRPAGTEGWSEDKLAALVTRDCMIGTGLPKQPDEVGVMDGIHDMGGMHGFGKVEPEDERAGLPCAPGKAAASRSTAPWATTGIWTIDETRAGIEDLPPEVYLTQLLLQEMGAAAGKPRRRARPCRHRRDRGRPCAASRQSRSSASSPPPTCRTR